MSHYTEIDTTEHSATEHDQLNPHESISTRWRTYLRVSASLELVCAVGLMIGIVVTLPRWESYVDYVYAGIVCIVLTAFASGICAIISVECVTSGSAKVWTTVHIVFMVLYILFVAMIASRGRDTDLTAIFITSAFVIISHIVFCSLFGPLCKVKGLQRVQRRDCC